MSTIINDNFDITVAKVLDHRSCKIESNVTVPYASTTEANTIVPIGSRAKGLIMFVSEFGSTQIYWYKDGTADVDLVKFNPYASFAIESSAFGSVLNAAGGEAGNAMGYASYVGIPLRITASTNSTTFTVTSFSGITMVATHHVAIISASENVAVRTRLTSGESGTGSKTLTVADPVIFPNAPTMPADAYMVLLNPTTMNALHANPELKSIGAFAAGAYSVAEHRGSIALGVSSIARGFGAVALIGGIAEADRSLAAMGGKTEGAGQDQLAIGEGVNTQADYAKAIGKNILITGDSSCAMGQNLLITGIESMGMAYDTEIHGKGGFATGRGGVVYMDSARVHSSGKFSAGGTVKGAFQISDDMLGIETSDATSTILLDDSGNKLRLDDELASFKIVVMGKKLNDIAGPSGVWTITGCYQNNLSTTATFPIAPVVTNLYLTGTGWTVSATLENISPGVNKLNINVVGEAAMSIRWSAFITRTNLKA